MTSVRFWKAFVQLGSTPNISRVQSFFLMQMANSKSGF